MSKLRLQLLGWICLSPTATFAYLLTDVIRVPLLQIIDLIPLRYLPQPIWDTVLAYSPDVWLWTGDAVCVILICGGVACFEGIRLHLFGNWTLGLLNLPVYLLTFILHR